MPESHVKLCRRFLHLHARLQSIRRPGPAPDEAVNLFLNIDERLFHDAFRISRDFRQCKDADNDPKPVISKPDSD